MGRQHHCCNCGTSFSHLSRIDEPDASYYPLGESSLICRRCVELLLEKKIGGMLQRLYELRDFNARHEAKAREKLQEITEILSFDVRSMPESMLRYAVSEAKKVLQKSRRF